MKKIAIFQSNLRVGGIQRSLANLICSDLLNDYDVDVYLFDSDIFYDLSEKRENIHIYFLKPFPFWCRFVPFELLRRIIHLPELGPYDYALDYDSYQQDCALYAYSQSNARKIMWIHSDLQREYRFNKKYRILYAFFKGKYKYFDEFVAVSKGIIEPFRKQSNQWNKRITVIPNPINVKEIQEKSDIPTNVCVDETKMNIACMGRIYLAKGYDFLLEDFENAYKKRSDLRLYILGDGPDASCYKKWVEEHQLDNVVSFLGNQKNPFNILKQMDAFCLESRYEGQGMVLWEAKALGLQLIFPKRLEKYNIYLKGTDDIVGAMVDLKKEEKKTDSLLDYSSYIRKQYQTIFAEKCIKQGKEQACFKPVEKT